MKRDIFFSELTPLNFKSGQLSAPPILSIISIFQLLIGAISTVLLPNIEDTCHESPIYTWMFIMIILLNCHLIITAFENLYKKIGDTQKFIYVHGIMVTGILLWLGLGHFWALFKGRDCYKDQVFIVATVLLGVIDVICIGITGLACKYYLNMQKTV